MNLHLLNVQIENVQKMYKKNVVFDCFYLLKLKRLEHLKIRYYFANLVMCKNKNLQEIWTYVNLIEIKVGGNAVYQPPLKNLKISKCETIFDKIRCSPNPETLSAIWSQLKTQWEICSWFLLFRLSDFWIFIT